MLRKWIAILLIISLLCTSYASALAGDYHLPESLKVIGEEAFANDQAADIYIPEGAETIGSRAFSGMAFERLHIPASVTYIAEDAIDYGMTIVCPMDSYAKEFIDNHPGWYVWVESDPLSREEAVDQLMNFDPSDYDDDTSPIETLEHLSNEGIDEPEHLADIEEYNQLVDQYNEYIGCFNTNEQDMMRGFREDYSFSDFDIIQADGEFRCGCLGRPVPWAHAFWAALEGGAEVTDTRNSDDGVTTITLSNGGVYYISGADTSFRLSADQPAFSNAAQAMSNASDDSALEKFKTAVSRIHDMANAINRRIQDGIDDLNAQIGRASGCLDKLDRKIEKLKTWRQNTMNPEYEHRRIERRRERLKARRARWILGLKIWRGLCILDSIRQLSEIIVKWEEIRRISECGHPNADDWEPGEAYEMASQLRRDIDTLRAMYITDGMMCVAEIISTITLFFTALPAAGAGRVLTELIKGAMAMLFHDYETRLYNTIVDTHPLLHTYLCGLVLDGETRQVLAGVDIDMDGCIYTTDENGYYKIRILDRETHSFRAVRQGYQDYRFQDKGVINNTWTRSPITLYRLKGTVFGHVYNSKTLEPVSFPRITSNEIVTLKTDTDDQPLNRSYGQEDGFYTADIPLPRESVTFAAEGFKEKVVELIPSTERQVEWDVKLEPYPGVDINAVNFPDETFREYVRGWDNDGNSVLTNQELINLRTINVGAGVNSVTGVEYFFNLERINVSSDATLDTLNVSGLDHLRYIYNSSAKLRGISVADMPRLLEVMSSSEAHGALKALSVSNCPKLYYVFCDNSDLSSFTAYACDRLARLKITNCMLTSLNVNHLKGLTDLNVSHNQLTSLTFSGAPKLSYVDCSYNQLETLDVRACQSLLSINVKENNFTYLDLRPANHAVLFASSFDSQDFAHYCSMAGNTGKKMEILTYGWHYDYDVHETLLEEVTRYLDGNVLYDWTFHGPVSEANAA